MPHVSRNAFETVSGLNASRISSVMYLVVAVPAKLHIIYFAIFAKICTKICASRLALLMDEIVILNQTDDNTVCEIRPINTVTVCEISLSHFLFLVSILITACCVRPDHLLFQLRYAHRHDYPFHPAAEVASCTACSQVVKFFDIFR